MRQAKSYQRQVWPHRDPQPRNLGQEVGLGLLMRLKRTGLKRNSNRDVLGLASLQLKWRFSTSSMDAGSVVIALWAKSSDPRFLSSNAQNLVFKKPAKKMDFSIAEIRGFLHSAVEFEKQMFVEQKQVRC
jgi:hypothetical protein